MWQLHVGAGKVLSRDLTQQLNSAIQFLVQCRPLSISMGNAIKYLKLQVRLGCLLARGLGGVAGGGKGERNS